MKRFNSLEERRIYYAEAAKRFRERRKQQDIAFYDPEYERVKSVRERALEMRERGVSLIMIWASLNVSWKELADILQITITPEDQHAFFNV